MYTKGPWVVNEAYGRWWIDSKSTGNQITPACLYENENDHDDALLIASAPELLEALEPFAEETKCGIGCHVGEDDEHLANCRECQLIMAARAAIAKATGK